MSQVMLNLQVVKSQTAKGVKDMGDKMNKTLKQMFEKVKKAEQQSALTLNTSKQIDSKFTAITEKIKASMKEELKGLSSNVNASLTGINKKQSNLNIDVNKLKDQVKKL
mmetsp:Transcript_10032/g.15265  ORF Transcript_10032/g.15265 Transcript_10032/m.15265 type:complete len:109 (+) Transcript_10032:1068-1394(+)